ncbi:MAG: thiamine-phosphate kinase [Chloroflexi bacterium]|nr:thiamine-phosphate kinase [Chloroflexota bacterium]
MKVSELGEFGLIELLSKMAYAARDAKEESWQNLVLGIGDDAAAWHADGSVQLATVDALVQNVHFSLDITPWEELGWRALAANLSDIAAMGGLPSYALVSLALPGDTEDEDITTLYKGMLRLAKHFGVAIIGGNISSAPVVVIDITVIGKASRAEQLLKRSAAKVGDKVAVTGYLGAAAAGLEMLKKHLEFDAESLALRKAFLQPYPRVSEGQILVEYGVKAAIDISDGLVADLGHICESSQVGARIEVDRVPLHPAAKANFGDRAIELALSGGEDYELLFAAPAATIDKVKAAATCPITVVGEIVVDKTNKVTLVDEKGRPLSLQRAGWDHFKR